MYNTRKVTEDIIYIGADDRRLALFENIFPIARGVSYNSYLIKDEKTALLDSVDFSVSRQMLENLEHELNGRNLDYMVVNHMEPDHCSLLQTMMNQYPSMKVVINEKMVPMIQQFFGMDLGERAILVKENDTLSLGKHQLTFIMAPLVHWPEVMMTYDSCDQVLFSADAFGTFGALNGALFADELDFDREWLPDARRYYTNIVGKFGRQVQNVLKKAENIEIKYIAPLHGPVWRTELTYILEKYQAWSSYEAEEKGVLIAYASMYGNTENAANLLASQLYQRGIRKVVLRDVSTTHCSELIAETFHYSHLVIACPTYNGGIYPVMENFLSDLKALNVQKKTVTVIQNGTWAPVTARLAKGMLEGCKEMKLMDNEVTIRSAVSADARVEIEELADALTKELSE